MKRTPLATLAAAVSFSAFTLTSAVAQSDQQSNNLHNNLAGMKAGVRLRSEQEPLWNAFQSAVEGVFRSHKPGNQAQSAAERRVISAAARPLYDSLDDTQKSNFASMGGSACRTARRDDFGCWKRSNGGDLRSGPRPSDECRLRRCPQQGKPTGNRGREPQWPKCIGSPHIVRSAIRMRWPPTPSSLGRHSLAQEGVSWRVESRRRSTRPASSSARCSWSLTAWKRLGRRMTARPIKKRWPRSPAAPTGRFASSKGCRGDKGPPEHTPHPSILPRTRPRAEVCYGALARALSSPSS